MSRLRCDCGDSGCASCGTAQGTLTPPDHRRSGWPGARCLDCGAEDARELCLADGHEDGCPVCADSPCREPGSRRHDPYAPQTEAPCG